MSRATVDNSQDILDSRDVIVRMEELQAERTELSKALDASHDADGATTAAARGAETALQAWDADKGDELTALCSFVAEGNAEWRHGETLIRASCFRAYAMGLADDIGAVPADAAWPLTCIDWDKAARELRMDYTGASHQFTN